MLTRAAVAPAFRAQLGGRRLGRAHRVYLVAGGAGLIIHASFALAGTTSTLVDDWLYCGLFFLAAAGCAYCGLRTRAARPWTLAAAGVAIWGTAEVVFRLVAATPQSLYPLPTEALLFLAFSLAYTTLSLLARERVRRFDPVLALDGVLASLAAAALAALFLFPVMTEHHHHAAPPRLFLLGALIGLMFVGTVLGMRIIAVCDAYHSMRSPKPYRRSRVRPQALAELRRCAGSQFDPSVVQALIDELAEEGVAG